MKASLAHYDEARAQVAFLTEGGWVRKRAYPLFLVRVRKLTTDLRSQLRNSASIKGMETEADGTWMRIACITNEVRRSLIGPKGPLAKLGIETYEGDVDCVTRAMLDYGVTIARPRRVYLDIETDSRVSFAKKEQMRVLAFALIDPETGEITTGCLRTDTDFDEAALLTELWQHCAAYDQIVAWNGDDFDFLVLHARSRAHRVQYNPHRWLFLDHLKVFKRMNTASESGDEKQSMALQNVAMSFLGEGKDDFDARYTWQAWEAGGEQRERMLRYCVKDTLLLWKLEQRTGFLELFQVLCETCGVFPDSRGLLPTRQVDAFMLRLANGRDEHFETRPWRDSVEKYAGAYVMEPKGAGIMRSVHVGDFASLYPSIMISWNISPDTKLVGDTEGLPHSATPYTGAKFRTDTVGMLPEALKQLLLLRKASNDLKSSLPPGTPEWKDADRKATAYKVAANSFYGVIGSPSSRFYDRAVGEAITQNGVYLIKETITAAEARGMRVVYGDSITGDRTVVLKSPDGWVKILPIEQLWVKASAIGVRDDSKEVCAVHGWQALTERGWKRVTSVIRHRVKKPVHMLTTKHGQARVTQDHSLMIAGKQVRPADFVANGHVFDVVPAPLEIRANDTLDLLNHVCDFEDRYAYKKREVIRRFAAHGADGIILEGWGGCERVVIRRFYKHGSPEFLALLRLVGAYVSDGSASLRGRGAVRYLLSFCKADLALQTQLKADLELVFQGGSVFGPFWTDTVYVVRSGTSAMASLFDALCGSTSRKKRMPSFVYELVVLEFSVLKQALLNGDGSTDASGAFLFTSTSQELIAGISYLLSQHGELHSHAYREEKGAWTIRTRKGAERKTRYNIKHSVEVDFEGFVYDLSVEDAHTFVDGVGRVLLHNTDSVFVHGGSKAEFEQFVLWCNDSLYPQLLRELGAIENRITLAYEKEFDRVVFAGKKRYCARFAHYKGKVAAIDSKPEVKGFEYKRSDTALLARKLQERAIVMLMDGATDPLAFRDLVSTAMDRVLHGELEQKEYVMAKGLSRPIKEYATRVTAAGVPFEEPVHVRVAKMMAARGEDVGMGTRIEYVVVDGSDRLCAIPAADMEREGLKPDRFYLWENLVYPPLQRLLEAAFPSEDWVGAYAKVRPAKTRRRRVDEQQLGFAKFIAHETTECEVLVASEAMLERALDVASEFPGAQRLVFRLGASRSETNTFVSGTLSFLRAIEQQLEQ
jgi:DNA polymerase elongation subunit (family B)